MQTYHIADKVLVYLLKRYKNNNNSSNASFKDVESNFIDTDESMLVQAIEKLKTDGFLEIMYYNDKPGSIFVKLAKLHQIDEISFADKGYNSYKEILDIIMPPLKNRGKQQ